MVDITVVEGEKERPCDGGLHALCIDVLDLLHQESHVARQIVGQVTLSLHLLHDLASGQRIASLAFGRQLAFGLPVSLGVESSAGIVHADWLIILSVYGISEIQ